jgi:pSer/pThr/pTyr-binding forkhead associated (FHA) protein
MLAAHDLLSPLPPRLRASRPSLVWTFSAHLDWFGRTVPVRCDDLVIGRSGADLEVDDRGVSRRHARLSRGPDGGWTLTDLGSTNGTFVNGVRVRVARLRDGDEIRVGAATAFRFSTSEEARGAAVLAA